MSVNKYFLVIGSRFDGPKIQRQLGIFIKGCYIFNKIYELFKRNRSKALVLKLKSTFSFNWNNSTYDHIKKPFL